MSVEDQAVGVVTKPVQAGTGQQPVGTLFEVFRRILQQRTEGDALRAVALMRQGRVVELFDTLALGAARLSFDLCLPLADSIILHTARLLGARVWTQDAHFESLPGVAFVRKVGLPR